MWQMDIFDILDSSTKLVLTTAKILAGQYL